MFTLKILVKQLLFLVHDLSSITSRPVHSTSCSTAVELLFKRNSSTRDFLLLFRKIQQRNANLNAE